MSTNRVFPPAAGLIACLASFGLLAACSDSKSISSATTSSTAAPTTVPEIVAPSTPPTSVAETVPPTIAPPSCSDETAPSGAAENVTIVDGDWNGDGVVDAGVSWAEPSGGGMNWFMRAEVSGGLWSTVALGELGAGYAQALDNVDVDFALGAEPGVNRDELIAIVGGGASGLNLGIFGVGADGCMFRFDDGAGSPFVAPIAATTGQMSGLMCDGGAGSQFLVVLHASTVDDINWDTVDYRLEREGDHSLVPGIQLENSYLSTDAALDLYSRAQCGGTVWVG